MNWILKHIILSGRGKFILVLIGVYIAVFTAAFPYGIIPSMVISLTAPLSIFLVAYPNYFILLPRFSENNKKIYILLSLLLIVAAMAFVWMCLSILFNVFDLPRDGFSDKYSQLRFLNPILFILTYIFSNVFYIHNRHHDLINKITNEKKELEMRILKSQINTHFLHNALNNIYSMIYFENKDDAAKYVMKLSQMLRYVLEDCEADRVPISGEIKYIENYIDFQKSRYETDRDITFNYVQNYNGEIQVPPMIFQPLIENCFNYCPLQDDNSYVRIEITAEQEQVRFISENTQPPIKQPSVRNSGGIGIRNLKDRLYLNFEDNYSLNIQDNEDVYRTELIINL